MSEPGCEPAGAPYLHTSVPSPGPLPDPEAQVISSLAGACDNLSVVVDQSNSCGNEKALLSLSAQELYKEGAQKMPRDWVSLEKGAVV